jgi:ribosomal protein S18 acetylase RimI-like enzyme
MKTPAEPTIPKPEKFEIKIESEVPSDLEGILEVLYLTWLDTYVGKVKGVTKESVDAMFAWRLDKALVERAKSKAEMELVSHVEKKIFGYVAKHNGRIVGYAKFMQFETSDQLEIIYVLPEYQNQGIGRKFWGEMMQKMTPGKKVIVDVVAENDEAIKWYKSLGFVDNDKKPEGPMFEMPVSGIKLPEIELEYLPG